MKKHMIQVIKLFFFVAVSAAVYEEMDNTAEVFLFALLCYGIFFLCAIPQRNESTKLENILT